MILAPARLRLKYSCVGAKYAGAKSMIWWRKRLIIIPEAEARTAVNGRAWWKKGLPTLVWLEPSWARQEKTGCWSAGAYALLLKICPHSREWKSCDNLHFLCFGVVCLWRRCARHCCPRVPFLGGRKIHPYENIGGWSRYFWLDQTGPSTARVKELTRSISPCRSSIRFFVAEFAAWTARLAPGRGDHPARIVALTVRQIFYSFERVNKTTTLKPRGCCMICRQIPWNSL